MLVEHSWLGVDQYEILTVWKEFHSIMIRALKNVILTLIPIKHNLFYF